MQGIFFHYIRSLNPWQDHGEYHSLSIHKNIDEEVKLGIFSSHSEAINVALKKAYAGKSRTYLRVADEKGRHHRSGNTQRA